MISGTVHDGRARIRLRVKGPRKERVIDALIDTGYSGELTLPEERIKQLGLGATPVTRRSPTGVKLISTFLQRRSSGTVSPDAFPSITARRSRLSAWPYSRDTS